MWIIELKCVFESEKQCSEFLSCLMDGYVPLKFAYVGSAAHTHDLLASTEGYGAIVGSVKEEISALREGLLKIDCMVPFNVVELGPGNGRHTGAFIAELSSVLTFSKFELIDYSKTLVDLASQRLSDVYPNIEFNTSQADLEDYESNIEFGKGDDPNLILLFGNTLGNVESWKKSLQHLFDGMRSNDILFTSYAIYDPKVEPSVYLDGYRTSELRNAALEPLVMTGADTSSVEFVVSFNAEQSAIVGKATFLSETVISCSGKEVPQPTGSSVRCFLSRRFSPLVMKGAFESIGFELLAHVPSADQSISYLMAKKL
ncbi:L-histidine N(alpha)-methyltransferase [Ruegeria atlantica]|uniref:L-histidine N(alpha)-methyltransferase n=1 Tax=Ruegeria atlantica TaxID=81569 RepID=UPI00147F5A96|nr:L-histidine N(alpha)-methyltransferase [Ruegeria atlantica]